MKRLKLPWLLLMDHSISLTNHAESIVRVHLFVHVGLEIFMAEKIVRFFGSQVTGKGVIMMFFQDFHPKGLNLGYIQDGSFVEKLPALRSVAKVDI